MQPIKFIVMERELVERLVSEEAPKRVQRKAVRLLLIADSEEDAVFANEQLFETSFKVYLPASEYDNYPVGGEFLLVSRDTV